MIAALVNDQTMIEAQQQAVGSHDIIGHGDHVVVVPAQEMALNDLK